MSTVGPGSACCVASRGWDDADGTGCRFGALAVGCSAVSGSGQRPGWSSSLVDLGIRRPFLLRTRIDRWRPLTMRSNGKRSESVGNVAVLGEGLRPLGAHGLVKRDESDLDLRVPVLVQGVVEQCAPYDVDDGGDGGR